MSAKPISEKAAEILFNRFLLQAFPLGGVQLFAPSSLEEFRNGYDAKIVGFSAFRELYLQFKAPRYSERLDRFTISATQHQHRLLKTYVARAAYYIAPMFRSLTELNSAQAYLETAKDFLRNFVCIEVAPLPNDVDFFQFISPANFRELPLVNFKSSSDKTPRTATNPVCDGRLRGSTLFSKFKAGTVGVHVDLTCDCPEHRSNAMQQTHPGIPELTGPVKPADFAVVVRIPL